MRIFLFWITNTGVFNFYTTIPKLNSLCFYSNIKHHLHKMSSNTVFPPKGTMVNPWKAFAKTDLWILSNHQNNSIQSNHNFPWHNEFWNAQICLENAFVKKSNGFLTKVVSNKAHYLNKYKLEILTLSGSKFQTSCFPYMHSYWMSHKWLF